LVEPQGLPARRDLDRQAQADMTPKTLGLAETWAKLGYVSFAADIFGYGQGVLPKDVAEMQAQTAIYTKDRTLMRARTQAGFDALVKNPMVDASKVALIGYCFGGAVGVEFGATGAPLVANVSIHGSFRDHEEGWAKNAKGMYLILHGAEDEGYPLTTVDRVIQELRVWKVPFQLEVRRLITSALPVKRTNSGRLGMFALCQKRTNASQQKRTAIRSPHRRPRAACQALRGQASSRS
jgi:dienelactone hydrolase